MINKPFYDITLLVWMLVWINESLEKSVVYTTVVNALEGKQVEFFNGKWQKKYPFMLSCEYRPYNYLY